MIFVLEDPLLQQVITFNLILLHDEALAGQARSAESLTVIQTIRAAPAVESDKLQQQHREMELFSDHET